MFGDPTYAPVTIAPTINAPYGVTIAPPTIAPQIAITQVTIAPAINAP